MGKLGRIACIFTPYALTIASLICLILVNVGNTNKDNSSLSHLYFFRLDFSSFTAVAGSSDLDKVITVADKADDNADQKLAEALQTAKKNHHLSDFYDIGLWNYCSGDKKNDQYQLTNCSDRQAAFWFNLTDVWHLDSTDVLPSNIQKDINVYREVSKWMFFAYVAAFISTVVELIVGVFAICSRWGSCVTSIVSAVAFGFTLAASITSTVLFATLTGTLNTALKPYDVKTSMGTSMLATTWLAVAFSLGSILFWLLSSCCCSGRSPYHGDRRGRRVTAEKAPYTYERVGSPYVGNAPGAPTHGGNNVPMQKMRTEAYEPFRHV